MILYEVNLDVDAAVAAEYGAWLREHIRGMLKVDGFEAAAWYARDAAVAGRRAWTIHYQIESREALQAYFSEHAERMRDEGLKRFEGHVEAKRRVLEQRERFSGVITEE